MTTGRMLSECRPAHDREGGGHPELAVKHLELLDIIKGYEVGKGDYIELDPGPRAETHAINSDKKGALSIARRRKR